MQTHSVDDSYLVSFPTGPAVHAALLRVSLRASGVLEVTKETEEKLVKEDETDHRSVHSAATLTSQDLIDDTRYLQEKFFYFIAILQWGFRYYSHKGVFVISGNSRRIRETWPGREAGRCGRVNREIK